MNNSLDDMHITHGYIVSYSLRLFLLDLCLGIGINRWARLYLHSHVPSPSNKVA